MKPVFRIGHGYDVHALADNRPLIIGGVTIPHTRGLAGHSDADVLTHAIMDALLGALALGNIGDHFPDTDPQYKGADSLKLLIHVVELVRREGYGIQNVDAVLAAQVPKFQPFISAIRTSLARTMGMDVGGVSVKATTTEGLGFEGRKEGISCHAVVLVSAI